MNKKIIFWLDSDFVQFGLAYHLQKKRNFDFYSIVDITNKTKSFFENQNIIKFKKTWYYFDHIKKSKKTPDLEYLKRIEKKYDLNLWELALNERIFQRFNHFYDFSTNEILLILEQECKLFELILNEVKPDYFLAKETIQHKDELFYQICKKSGVKPLMRCEPKFGYRSMITEESQKFDSKNELDDMQNNGRTFDELIKYRDNFNPSNQIKAWAESFAPVNNQRLRAASKFLFFSENNNAQTHYTYYGRTKLRVLYHEIIMHFKKRQRKSFIDKNFLTTLQDNEKFIYFALSVDEERNLLITTPFLTNQLEMIRNIVKSMPVDFKLYVKEPPAQSIRNWRSISEYKEIMKIPGVTMVHPSVSPSELYKKCSLVITISGSSSFEAAFYGKPSIVFADVSYTILPSVMCVSSINELSKAINDSLETTVNVSDLDKYVNLLEKNSFNFDVYDLDVKQHNDFFYGGNYIDVEISDSKMLSFLKENESEFEQLSDEYLKKMSQS